MSFSSIWNSIANNTLYYSPPDTDSFKFIVTGFNYRSVPQFYTLNRQGPLIPLTFTADANRLKYTWSFKKAGLEKGFIMITSDDIAPQIFECNTKKQLTANRYAKECQPGGYIAWIVHL